MAKAPEAKRERENRHVLGFVAIQPVRGAGVHRGDRPQHFAENVVDMDGVGGEAAAELAVEGAAPGRRTVVDFAAVPVGLGGGDRGGGGETLGAKMRELLQTEAEAVLEYRRDPPTGGGLGSGDGVDLGEALRHRLLHDDVIARRQRRQRLRLVQPRGGANIDDVEVARQQVVERADRCGDAEPRRDLRAASGVDVAEHRHLVHLWQRLVGLDVRGADPRADHADLEPGHGRAPPSGWAIRCASSASCIARKQCVWSMAVAVRFSTSSRSFGP